MTTASFDARVVLVSETEDTDPSKLDQVDGDLSFQLTLDGETRMLSSGNLSKEASVRGFIYVPLLDPDDRCGNSTASIISRNVTRREDFPRTDYDFIALAPWVSPNCTRSYLTAAADDDASAFVFYKPGSGSDLPPPFTDSMWDLHDEGSWRSDFEYPVYAVSGKVGSNLMDETAEYSGELTDLDHGSELSGEYDTNKLPRLSVSITSDDHSGSLPNLWLFLIGVLAILLTFVISSSIVMRWIQRRRRRALARRLAAGEVDLEAIGIKKLKVPRSMLDKMPLYIYTETSTPAVGEKPPDAASPCGNGDLRLASLETQRAQYGTVDASDKGLGMQYTATSPAGREPGSYSNHDRAARRESTSLFSQSTCPICLNDYVPHSTNVRELPCGHIFHPECIDTFLLRTSSLCPMCKKCSLPPGFCPEEVTNAMVYRERLFRAHQRGTRSRPLPTPIPTRSAVYRNRSGYQRPARSPASRTSAGEAMPDNGHQSIFSRLGLRGRPSAETDTPQVGDDVVPGNDPTANNTVATHNDDTTHEERMRQRAVAMLGPHNTEEDRDRDEESAPRWRRALNKYFPGFR